jgi:hypothetical protein
VGASCHEDGLFPQGHTQTSSETAIELDVHRTLLLESMLSSNRHASRHTLHVRCMLSSGEKRNGRISRDKRLICTVLRSSQQHESMLGKKISTCDAIGRCDQDQDKVRCT